MNSGFHSQAKHFVRLVTLIVLEQRGGRSANKFEINHTCEKQNTLEGSF